MQSSAVKIESGSAEWHASRLLGIGGSDAAAALGLSKYKTPFQLYEEKLGLSTPEDENWNMARGKAMEPLLRQHYADTTGREVALPVDVMVSEKYPFMRYNPDGLALAERRLQEFKTATYGPEWGQVGSDEIPQEYILQVQHGMIVTGFEVCDVTVSIGGNAPKYFIVEADHELQEMIIDGEAAFWAMVKNGVVPEPINNEDVARMYNKVNGQSIIATAEIMADVAALQSVRATLKNIEMQKEELEVKIKSFIGNNEILVNGNMVPLITWKQAAGAKRIDGDRLKAEQPAIAAEYTKTGEPSRRFLVK